MADKLYEHTAYSDAPFGPYEPERAVVRGGGVAVSVKDAAGEYAPVLSISTVLFKWGQLVIDSAMVLDPAAWAPAGPLVIGQVESFPWIEIKVVVVTGGIEEIWFEGALIPAFSPLNSGGPISLPFAVGELRDRIDVFARAWQGNRPVVGSNFLSLDVTAVARFSR